MTSLQWSPSWEIESADAATGEVVVAAGADRRVALDGLAPCGVAELIDWRNADSIDHHSVRERAALDRLVELGAVAIVPRAVAGVQLIGSGSAVDELAAHVPTAADGFAVVVRTAPDWPAAPDELHVGLDLTLHHTVVLGPLVVRGVTACLACVETRRRHRWGVPVVAARPQILESLSVVAALLAIQVDLAQRRQSPLINATIAWDLEQGTTSREQAYKLVGCPTCAVPNDGRVALPWLGADVGR